MEKDKITLPSGETFSKWRFIDIDRIEYSEEHKDKFEKKLCDKIPIRKISVTHKFTHKMSTQGST